jgi:hypothetical protein
MKRTFHKALEECADRTDCTESFYLRCRHSLLSSVATSVLFCTTVGFGQASPTAERQVNVQLGAAISLGYSGISRNVSVSYGGWKCEGATVYATVDPHPRLGMEFEGRRVSSAKISESAILVGARYHKPYGLYVPYGKVLVGRSQFGFSNQLGKPSFSTLATGAGFDYRMSPTLRIRFDYEWQHWIGLNDTVHGFPGSMNPQVVSVGLAYHVK